jgi:hypothetical protein
MSARALQDDAILKAPAGSDRTISTDAEPQPRPHARSLPRRPVSDSRRDAAIAVDLLGLSIPRQRAPYTPAK